MVTEMVATRVADLGHYFDGSDLTAYAGSASGPSDIVGRDGGGWADTSHTDHC